MYTWYRLLLCHGWLSVCDSQHRFPVGSSLWKSYEATYLICPLLLSLLSTTKKQICVIIKINFLNIGFIIFLMTFIILFMLYCFYHHREKTSREVSCWHSFVQLWVTLLLFSQCICSAGAGQWKIRAIYGSPPARKHFLRMWNGNFSASYLPESHKSLYSILLTKG